MREKVSEYVVRHLPIYLFLHICYVIMCKIFVNLRQTCNHQQHDCQQTTPDTACLRKNSRFSTSSTDEIAVAIAQTCIVHILAGKMLRISLTIIYRIDTILTFYFMIIYHM